MPSPYQVPRLRSHAKAGARHDEERKSRYRKMLAISIMSAITLSAVLLARAETWVTVGPDGSVQKTEVRTQASQAPTSVVAARSFDRFPEQAYGTFGSHNGSHEPVLSSSVQTPVSGGATGNTTFFAGTHYPVPSYGYSYHVPGYTYPVGPIFPRVTPPTITTLPSTGHVYGTGAPYCYPAYPAPPAGYCPYPVYTYPNYAASGVYYSGPAGGGGTIYSQSTTRNNGFGVKLGSDGLKVSVGNKKSSTQSTTTVTTTGPRY